MVGVRVGEVKWGVICAVLREGDLGLYVFVSLVAYENFLSQKSEWVGLVNEKE
jgi:hypothetical protein